MRKVLSILAAVALLLSLVSTVSLLTVADEGDGVMTGSWRSAQYNFCNMTHGADGLMTFGDIPDDMAAFENIIFEFDEELDLYYVEDIQFRFENNTGLPLTFTNIAPKAAVTTNDNAGIVENDVDFWNGYPGFVWLSNVHDFNEAPVYVKADGATDWALASKDSYGPDPACFTIPADFKGLVKLPLSAKDHVYDDGTHRISRGIGMTLLTGVAGGGEGKIDSQGYEGKTMRINQVRPTMKEDGIAGAWRSAQYNFCNMVHGEDGLMTFGDIPDGMAAFENIIYEFEGELDLYYVEDIQFYFDNDTGLPLTFTNIAPKAAVTTNDNAGIVDNDVDFWNGYPGYLWLSNTHNFEECPVYVKANGTDEWVLASKESAGPDPACFTIPAGFEGMVKLPLNLADRSYADGSHRISRGIGMTLLTGVAGGGEGKIDSKEYEGKTMRINKVDATVNPVAELYPAPTAPTGLSATACTTAEQNDGTITGVNDTMEYCGSDGVWTAVPAGATTITGLTSGTYTVRVKANSPYPAGATTSVKVAAWVSPDLKGYVTVVEDFEDVTATADIIKGVEYTFLGGTDWIACENANNNSAAVKQLLFGTAEALQKTFITTPAGDISNADYFQVYLEWDGETDICLAGAVGASMSTPTWYRWMEAHFADWNGEQDPSKFWKNYILMQGNTGAMCSVSDAIKEAYYQDADGNWVEAESVWDGAIIPAGYKGYVRFPIPADKRFEDVPFGFGWTLFDPTKGDIEGTMLIDDVALVTMSTTPVDGMMSFEEYVQVKGNGFDPDKVPTTTTTESKPTTTTTKPTDIVFDPDEDIETTTTTATAGDETDKAPVTGVTGMLVPMILLAAAACLVLGLSRKAAKTY